MKMNTNGANNFDGVGPNCYHFTSLLTPVASMISNDFIGIANATSAASTIS
jgi:hypothetical protein